MPWHVAAAAVWLVVMGWCGSIVTGQPVTGIQDHRIEMPQRYPSNEEGQAIRQLWGMGDPVDDKSAEIQDEDFRQDLYYLPKVPSKRFTPEEESGWFVQTQDRSKRQSHTNSGSSNHHSHLSIISPIEALRSRLRLEMMRRQYDNQLKQNQNQLEKVGKRRKRSHANDSNATVHGFGGKRILSESAGASAAIKEP